MFYSIVNLLVLLTFLILVHGAFSNDLLGYQGSCFNDHSRCHSGYCYDTGSRVLEESYWHLCAKPSSIAGKVGGGGNCRSDVDCYSNYCPERTERCSADSPTQGKIGLKGICESDSQCYSGSCKLWQTVKVCKEN